MRTSIIDFLTVLDGNADHNRCRSVIILLINRQINKLLSQNRNPHGTGERPWCYDIGSINSYKTSWAYCRVEPCARTPMPRVLPAAETYPCYAETGVEYNATGPSRTAEGFQCASWNDDSVPADVSKIATIRQSLLRIDGTTDHNYCRNADGSGLRPWCYDVRSINNFETQWGYCDLTQCPPSGGVEPNGTCYNGAGVSYQSTGPVRTVDGLLCARWDDDRVAADESKMKTIREAL